jgi:hypothetical protein
MTTKTSPRSLSTIASEIRKDWKAQTKDGKIPEPALAYLNPMSTLDSIDDRYMFDSGRSVVAYFLGNATTWKGDKAREIKKELNAMLKR